jgi:hypothetical protein
MVLGKKRIRQTTEMRTIGNGLTLCWSLINVAAAVEQGVQHGTNIRGNDFVSLDG